MFHCRPLIGKHTLLYMLLQVYLFAILHFGFSLVLCILTALDLLSLPGMKICSSQEEQTRQSENGSATPMGLLHLCPLQRLTSYCCYSQVLGLFLSVEGQCIFSPRCSSQLSSCAVRGSNNGCFPSQLGGEKNGRRNQFREPSWAKSQGHSDP